MRKSPSLRIVDAVGLAGPQSAADEEAVLKEKAGDDLQRSLRGADGHSLAAVHHHVAIDHRQEAVAKSVQYRLAEEAGGPAGFQDHAARRRDGKGHEAGGGERGGDFPVKRGRALLSERDAAELLRRELSAGAAGAAGDT